MTEQQGLNFSPSPQNSQPLESSFGGDLSDPQMLDQIFNQLFAQLPEPLTSPEAIAEMVPQMLTGQGSSQPVATAQPQSSSQSPKQPEAQPQQTNSGQSSEQLLSDAQPQLSSLQGLDQIIDPIMSEPQQLISGLESLDLLGVEAQQQLSRGSTPNQMAGTSQPSPDLHGKTPTSAPLTPVPQGDTSGSALMPKISSAKTPNLSPTQTSKAATKSTTAPSTAATEANRQGRQVPSKSPSSGNAITGMGDLSLSEFLPNSAELQRLFEQRMGAVLPTKPALPASPQSGSDQMGAAGSTSTALQNPEQVGSEVEPKAKTVLNPEQAGAVGQQSFPDIQGKTPASSQPASLFDQSSSDYYFLQNLSPSITSAPSTLSAGDPSGTNTVAPEQLRGAIKTQSRELQGQGEGEIQNLKQLGGRSTSEALPQVEMLPGAELLSILQEGAGHIPLSEADLHQSVTEPPAAVPLPPGSTPKFYFLPDSKPAESSSSKPSTDQQTSQLPQDSFDVEAVRRDFPILNQQVHGKPLIWMDNAATSQKPQSVIDTLSQFYEQDNSNVHRGAHTLAARSTNAYEDAREKIQQFLGASLAKEIVFVRGTTEGINLVAQTYGRNHVKAGDEIVLTTLEHHSNIVPWQMLAQEKGVMS